MKTYPRIILFGFAFLIASCGSSYQTLKTKQEDDFKLANYATFGFFDIEANGDTIPANFEKSVGIIKNAIAGNLQKRGLDEARDPSLKINIALSVRNEVQTRQTDFRTDGLPRYMGQRRYSWKSEEVVTGNYREGTMMIDLVDSATNKLVWQGGSEGIIPGKSKNFEAEINEMIQDIVSKIP